MRIINVNHGYNTIFLDKIRTVPEFNQKDIISQNYANSSQ